MTTTKTKQNGRVFSYMRWSSEPQTWGDSERRQAQAAQDWCCRNGRTLIEQTYADRGISGWKGANRQTGALGALLKHQRGEGKGRAEDSPGRKEGDSRENPPPHVGGYAPRLFRHKKATLNLQHPQPPAPRRLASEGRNTNLPGLLRMWFDTASAGS